ncbi:restriction modification system DNA specificity domain protein [Shewanella baltica OS625]|uniref:restriction endonuclease subunit S n=1 Tax=Shewanella baltica TaxID=62322 RepID=UPI000230DD45|nr:restriction endonuclease subunit S [Shewanella baltica]EHC04166.1 restriction modification system DNA specificity domain protein [Shewanella baltica OS625]
MKVDKKVPEIRFKGFSGEWCNSELKSLCNSFSYGLNASAIKFDGVNKYLRITDIDEKNRHFASSALTSPDADLSKSNDYLLKNGDILFARTGASVGKTYIYNEQDGKVYFAGFLIRASVNDKTNAQFIFQNTHTHEYAKFVTITSQRSGQPGINAKEYSEYQLFTPVEKEQVQIGNYFQKLDSLINQHQQKHDKLSSIKKAMLEKMFPEPGATVPEIRFKGFSGDWEKVRLGDMVTCFSGGTPLVGVEEYYKGAIPFIRSAEINKANTELTISESGLKKSSAKIVEVGTVLYALYGATSGEVGRAKLSGAINQAILAIIPMAKMCPEFLSQWLRKSKRSIVSTYLQGGQGNLSSDIVKNLVLMSTTLEEQTAIGNYFQKLDTLINQHQQQITKLTNIKQACLSKMFV